MSYNYDVEIEKANTLRARRIKSVLTAATFIALAVLIYALRRQIAETFSNFGRVNLAALPLIIVWQVINYHSYAKMYERLFNILGHRIPYRWMLRTNAELNFVNTVFPSGGVSGFSYFSMRMKSQGISTGQATLVQIMRFGLVFASFQILLLTGLLVLAAGGQANDVVVLVAGSLATLLLVGTLVIGFIIGSEQRIDVFFTFIAKVLNRIIQIVRPKYPETISIARVRRSFKELHFNYILLRENYRQLVGPLAWALLANTMELLTIYTVYLAFGYLVNPGAVILAYAVANFAGLISVLPGGIGIYEALMTAVLASAGVPAAVSLPVTVMFRILSMFVQLPIGYYFYQKTLQERPDQNV